MQVIRISKQLDSDTLHLPELQPLIGKRVEITVREEPAIPQADSPDRWQPLIDAACKDLVDPEVYKQYREFDRRHNVAPEP